MADMEPNKEIVQAGWTNIRDIKRYFSDSSATPQLIEWENEASVKGRSRKLTYIVATIPDTAVVEIWLVTQEGRTFVNTLKAYRQ